MSRTFVPPSSAQRRKGRLGINTSRRYNDVSVLTFQVTVYKISRDLPVKTERTSRIFVSRSNNASGRYRLGVISPRGNICWMCQRLGVVTSRTYTTSLWCGDIPRSLGRSEHISDIITSEVGWNVLQSSKRCHAPHSS
jgi:hypothetical protein